MPPGPRTPARRHGSVSPAPRCPAKSPLGQSLSHKPHRWMPLRSTSTRDLGGPQKGQGRGGGGAGQVTPRLFLNSWAAGGPWAGVLEGPLGPALPAGHLLSGGWGLSLSRLPLPLPGRWPCTPLPLAGAPQSHPSPGTPAHPASVSAPCCLSTLREPSRAATFSVATSDTNFPVLCPSSGSCTSPRRGGGGWSAQEGSGSPSQLLSLGSPLTAS